MFDKDLSGGSRVFLCHNTKDKPEINRIRSLLEGRKIRTFMDQYDFKSFGLWEQQLKSEIKNFQTAAIFLGKSGLGPWQIKEIEMFFSELKRNPENRRIGLVLLPGCFDSLQDEVIKQWPELGKWQWTNFSQDIPDPVECLISGVSSYVDKVGEDQEKKLISQKENYELRAELFQIVASGFQDRAEELFQEIEKEKVRIIAIEKEMNQIVLSSCNTLSPEVNKMAEIFKNNIDSFAKRAAEFAVETFLEEIGNNNFENFHHKFIDFETEIKLYLLRIHTSIITARSNSLQKSMEHKSGLEADFYIKALDYVEEMLKAYQFESTSQMILISNINMLKNIISYR